MGRVIRRDAVAILLASLACGLISVFPPFSRIHGWSIDALTALRWEVFGTRRDPASTPVAVIAIDEETYETPPFKGSPTLTWTTEVGRVLDAVIEGGAKVVGFDIVFPTSIEQSELPFGDDLLGGRVRGFDRPFLRSLATGASAGKVVLGEVLRGERSIRPSPGQRIAVGQQKNIRALNIYSDPDEVVRKMPLMFWIGGKPVPSMALELASRALNTEPVLAEDGSVMLAGYLIPSAVPNTLTLNFEGGANDVQTFSFADLHACVERANTDFFQREFANKIVIFGTLLDSEDRKLTSKRFATGLDGSRARALRATRGAAAPFSIQAQFDRRRLHSCDRSPQSHGPGRGRRTWPVPNGNDGNRVCSAGLARCADAGAGQCRGCLSRHGCRLDLLGNICICAIVGVAPKRANSRWALFDGCDCRIPAGRHR